MDGLDDADRRDRSVLRLDPLFALQSLAIRVAVRRSVEPDDRDQPDQNDQKRG